MRKNIILTAFIMLFGVVNLFSQTSADNQSDANVAGHIINKSNGEHVPFMSIKVIETGIHTMSDATGHFFLRNLPEGTFKIEFSAMGYKSVVTEVTTVRGRTLELNIEVEESALMVDEVVVTATRNLSKRRDAPSVVNVVGKKLFESTGSSNLSQVLNFIPGVRVDVSCQNCAVTEVRINGLEGQYSQILLDGRPMFSALATVYGIEQLPAEMIERVEVVRGGGSAVYGSNAIGGVVNIITKEPLTNIVTLSSSLSVFGKGATETNTAFNGSFISDDYKSGVYLFGIVRDKDGYDRNDDGFSDIPVISSEIIGFRGHHKPTNNSRITAEYHHIREYRRGGDSLHLPPHDAMIAEQLRHKIDGGSLKYDVYSNNLRHRLNLFAAAQTIKRDSYFGTEMNLDAYGNTNDNTYSVGAQYSVDLKQIVLLPSELTVGIEYNYNSLLDKMLGHGKVIDQVSFTYGGYLQNEWKGEKSSLLVGARIDKNNFIDNPVISPRINLRFTPYQDLVLRASYSTGFRAPQIYSEDLHVEAVGGDVSFIVNDPDLKPEYSHSFNISSDLYGTIGTIQTNLLVDLFHTKLRDVFALVEIGEDNQGNILLERRNEEGATISGINSEARFAYGNRISLQTGWTFQKSLYDKEFSWSEEDDLPPQRRMLKTPDVYGYLSLNWNPFKNGDLSFTGNYTGTMLMPHFAGYIPENREVTTPSFWDFGILASYSVFAGRNMNIKFTAGVKNILDSFQKDLDKGPLRDAGYLYGPVMPRTFNFGVKLTL